MRRDILLYLSIALLLALIYSAGSLATFLTDWKWFEALGLHDVFVTTVLARVSLGGVAGLLTFTAVQGSGTWALRHTQPRRLALADELEGSPLAKLVERTTGAQLITAVGLGFGLLVGLGASSAWETLLLALHGGDFGHIDPLLGNDAGFYVFLLPFLGLVRGILLAMVVVAGLVTGVTYIARGALQLDVAEIDGQTTVRGFRALPAARRHMGLLVALWLVILAAGQLLQRYGLLVDQSGLISGPGHTDATFTMPLLLAQAVATVLAGVLLYIGASRMRLAWLLGGAGLALTSLAAVGLVPGAVQQFFVLPNELELEAPYIEHHVAATRYAFQLGGIEERALSGDAHLTQDDIEANQPTIENIRLWDHTPLRETFSQVQEIRTYYEFNSVDNDRYVVDGKLRQTMLSPREIDPRGLPARARTWVNETMTYTHGYGVTLGPVNRVTKQGLPMLWVQDLPPQVKVDGAFEVERPEIYYGERQNLEVFVGTDNEEFDYPVGDSSVYTSYEGKGGVEVGGAFWKTLWSLRLGTSKVLFTNEIRPDSKVMLYRDIQTRIRRIAPFLRLDHDPYMVLDQGRQVWVQDAYTTTSRFPYAQAVGGYSYVRNSVKVTVDAYDGTVTLYVADATDPILAAWRSAFPSLFTPLEEMPESLQAHLRYPTDLFALQSDLFATYHMTDPRVFYNREDEWEVPVTPSGTMSPYYTVLELPGEQDPEFILMLPFVPRGKPNLAAWMVARSDGDAYGQVVVYRFPKDKFIYGPNQAIARFNQDDAISEKLSLWDQQGSSVVLGTLLVIPIEESLIYVQPLYLRATSGSIPELKRVIVGDSEENIVMAETLEDALEELFGAKVPEAAPAAPEEGSGLYQATPALQRAVWAFEDAQTAARTGDWATYGVELERLGAALAELSQGSEPPVEPEVEVEVEE